MIKILDSDHKLGVAVSRGLPDLSNAPRLADIVAKIQHEAAQRAQKLERFRLTPEGFSPDEAIDIWVVADVPSNESYETLQDALVTLSNAGPMAWGAAALDGVPEHPSTLQDMRELLWKTANMEAIAEAHSTRLLEPFVFPNAPRPCDVAYKNASYANVTKVAEAERSLRRAAARLGGAVVRMVVGPVDPLEPSPVGEFWVVADPRSLPCPTRTDAVQRLLARLTHERTEYDASPEETLRAFRSLEAKARKKLGRGLGF